MKNNSEQVFRMMAESRLGINTKSVPTVISSYQEEDEDFLLSEDKKQQVLDLASKTTPVQNEQNLSIKEALKQQGYKFETSPNQNMWGLNTIGTIVIGLTLFGLYSVFKK